MKLIQIKLNEDLTISMVENINVPSGNFNSILLQLDTNNVKINDLKLMATFKRLESIHTYECELDTITIDNFEYNNSCYVPVDVLNDSGSILIGAYAFSVVNEKIEKRVVFNPVSLAITSGSYKSNVGDKQTPDPTKYEEFVIKVNETKENAITDFTNYYEEKKATLKGDKGDRGEKGEKGDTGSIKFIIVSELPTEDIDETAIYLLPTGDSENAYDEYIFVDGEFEPLGQTQIEVDLTDYVKNTDYANNSVGGVIKVGWYGVNDSTDNGYLRASSLPYSGYNSYESNDVNTFISKGTLENVITGKGLVSDTDYATDSKGGTIKTTDWSGLLIYNGMPYARYSSDYQDYLNRFDGTFISKGTLECVLDNRIGTIETALQTLNDGEGVE